MLAALARPNGRQALAPVLGMPEAGLLLVVAIHMLLSGDLGRMGYLLAPVFTAAFALSIGWVRSELSVLDTPSRVR